MGIKFYFNIIKKGMRLEGENRRFSSSKGLFFTMDSMFALMIIVAVIPIFVLISLNAVSPELVHERVHLKAEDAINLMSQVKVIDVIREPKLNIKTYEIPCQYNWETKELKMAGENKIDEETN